MSRPILAFDMDGVLVDVTESYRETICRTVEHFTGSPITRELIQDTKNQGGWNDDWKLSHHLIRQAGVEVEFDQVVEYFQSIFHGDGSNGLMLRERWIAREGLIERLEARYQLAMLTGRMKWEAELTLERFGCAGKFAPIVGMAEVQNHKPHPEGLLLIGAQWYVGDTVDDARCAKAAGVPFIGIAAPDNPRLSELIELFRAEDAVAVLEDINYLEMVLR